jgi:microcin C transport system permease protein
LTFGFLLTLLSLCLGVAMGAVQGYFGGLVDLVGQRFQELWSSLPILFILIVLSSFVQPNLMWLLLIMLLFSWMGLAALVRAEFLRGRTYDYVKAARVLGAKPLRIMWRHILPNAMIATVTYLPFLLNHSISVLTSLDFLGFGLPLGTPSLGELVSQAKNNLYAPWLGVVAFGGISFVLVLVAFVGEGLRDAADAHTV